MANKSLFKGVKAQPQAPVADTKNSAGGIAYGFTPEHTLAQLAATGTFQDNASLSADEQLDTLKRVADQCSPEFIAKVAIYARQQGYMKDMPAALAVILSKADPVLLDKVFDRVIDNGKQLRNFVQMIRSGKLGRKSLGSGPARLIARWLDRRSDYNLFRDSVGNDPSLADVIRLARPAPQTESRQALYGYLLGNEPAVNDQPLVEEIVTTKNRVGIKRRYDPAKLPDIVKHFEAFKAGDRSRGIPNVDFRMLTSLQLTSAEWASIARSGGWHQTRMNLNTYARHGVFSIPGMAEVIAGKLTDEESIKRSKVFPYQLLAAFVNSGDVPPEVKLALQRATEIATQNVPAISGNVTVIVDVSGSMSMSVTGSGRAASAVRCVDVAGLVAATIVRKNPRAVVVPVDTRVHRVSINPLDSVMTNATKLASFHGGGTDLAAAMLHIERTSVPDVIIMVSDNESWYGDTVRGSRATRVMDSFLRMKSRNGNLKMVCLDIVAGTTSQTVLGDDSIMNLGGFSDQFWTIVQRFLSGSGPSQWIEEIKKIDLDAPDSRSVSEGEEVS